MTDLIVHENGTLLFGSALETLKESLSALPSKLVKTIQTLIKPEQIVIDDESIHVRIENCSYRWFEANPEFDHGLYESVQDFRDSVRQRFKLVKEIEWVRK